MHGLQACFFKCITVAAFRIYARVVKIALKGKVEGHALNSLISLLIMENHEILFLNFCGNPLMGCIGTDLVISKLCYIGTIFKNS